MTLKLRALTFLRAALLRAGLLDRARALRERVRGGAAWWRRTVHAAPLPKGHLDVRLLGEGRGMPGPLTVEYGRAGEDLAREMHSRVRHGTGEGANRGARGLTRQKQLLRWQQYALLAKSYRMSRERILASGRRDTP